MRKPDLPFTVALLLLPLLSGLAAGGPALAAGTSTAIKTTSNAQASSAPTASSVGGAVVLSALRAGVRPDPAAQDPYATGCRRLVGAAQASFWVCGAMSSYQLRSGFPGGSGIGAWGAVKAEPVFEGTRITAVIANGLRLEGASLDLAGMNPPIDTPAATWTNGRWSARLLVASVPADPSLMRVCWQLVLPAPAPVTGPPGFEPLVRDAPLKRTMCAVYSRVAPGPDRGGFLVDDVGGSVTTYEGTW